MGTLCRPTCQSANTVPSVVAEQSYALPYDLAQPTARFKLRPALREISGLTVIDDTLIAAIQDERGAVYVLDVRTGESVRTIDFGGKGDYEGVEAVGDSLYVLRSDGDVYVLPNWRAGKLQVTKEETSLSARNDTEGLGYDPVTRRLLIAAKEKPGDGYKGHRAVYAFDVATREVDDAPVYLVSTAIDTVGGPVSRFVRKLAKPISDLSGFKPAGLAVHPVTGHIFVVSSVLKVIVVLDRSGELVAMEPLLDPDIPQPEGIAFLRNGDLLIASEGAGKRGTLTRYAFRPN